jgi:excisionase family DNA binding protein
MTTSLLPTYFRTAESSEELLTVAEACAELRISKWTLYQYIHSRQLATIKLRSRRLIPRSAIRTLIDNLTIEAIA